MIVETVKSGRAGIARQGRGSNGRVNDKKLDDSIPSFDIIHSFLRSTVQAEG
jgi:hypothetical protein